MRSVNGGWTCQAIASSADAQFWRAPFSACVQVLNQRASVGFSIVGSPTRNAPAVVATGSPDWNVTMPFICQPPNRLPITPFWSL